MHAEADWATSYTSSYLWKAVLRYRRALGPAASQVGFVGVGVQGGLLGFDDALTVACQAFGPPLATIGDRARGENARG